MIEENILIIRTIAITGGGFLISYLISWGVFSLTGLIKSRGWRFAARVVGFFVGFAAALVLTLLYGLLLWDLGGLYLNGAEVVHSGTSTIMGAYPLCYLFFVIKAFMLARAEDAL